MSEDLKMELLKELRDEQREQGKLLHNIHLDVSKNTIDLAKNTQDLAEHMRRTEIQETKNDEQDKRLEVLEKPGIALSQIKKWVIYITGLCAGVLTIIKLFGGIS